MNGEPEAEEGSRQWEQAIQLELMGMCLDLTRVLMDALGLAVPGIVNREHVLRDGHDFLGHPLTVIRDADKVYAPAEWIYQTELLLAFKETYEPCRGLDEAGLTRFLRAMHAAIDRLTEGQGVSSQELIPTLEFFTSLGIFLGVPFEEHPVSLSN